MKKYLIFFLTIILLTNCSFIIASANENAAYSNIIKLNDGSYYITVIEETNNTRASTKTGSKTTRYYNSDDELLWSVTVKGTFSYTGSSAVCTASNVSTTCPASNWKISSKSSSKSGATATATATAKRYTIGVVTQTVTKKVTLTCSASGTLS